MTVVIDQAGCADAPGLIACIDAAYAGYHAQGIVLPDVTGGITEAIAKSQVWVARGQGEIAGVLILSLNTSEAYLENIAVHPDHAGQGIARQLLDVAYCTAKGAHCTVIKLTTHAGIPANIALYEHLGWQVTAAEGVKVAMIRNLSA